MNLSAPSGATISDGQGQGTITNDDTSGGPLDLSGVGGARCVLQHDGDRWQLGQGLGGELRAGRAQRDLAGDLQIRAPAAAGDGEP